MAAKPAAENAEAPKKSKKMLIIVIAVVLVLVIGGVAGFLFWKKKQAAEEEAGDAPAATEVKHKKAAHPPEFMPIDNMVVNLADPGGNRFAQIGITLQLDTAATGEIIKKYMPAVRNGVLMVISRRTAEELLTGTGKEQLAQDLLTLIRDTTDLHGSKKSEPIEAVLFSSFIVQ